MRRSVLAVSRFHGLLGLAAFGPDGVVSSLLYAIAKPNCAFNGDADMADRFGKAKRAPVN